MASVTGDTATGTGKGFGMAETETGLSVGWLVSPFTD